MDPRLSLTIIVPTFNEAAGIVDCLTALQALRALGAEVIVVDGGSCDGTPTLARPLSDGVISAPAGRALQMNAGARLASRDWLLFLHADTRLPATLPDLASAWDYLGGDWGFFALRLSGPGLAFRVLEFFINLRSSLTRIATGDQCLFVRRRAFEQIGGYPSLPLMEDIALSKRLKRRGRPIWVVVRAETSSRKWEREGIVRTQLLMWRLRLAYFVGADPAALARRYYRRR